MKRNEILFFFISTFILVAAWVGFNIYHTYVTSTVAEDVQSQLTPIDGTFDTKTIETLRTRQDVQPVYEYQGGQTQTASAAAQSVSANETVESNAQQPPELQGQ